MPLWQYKCSDSSSLSSTPPIPASPSHTTVLWQSVSTRAQAASNSKLTQRLYCSKCKTSGKGAVYCSRDCQVQKKKEKTFFQKGKKKEKRSCLLQQRLSGTLSIYTCMCVCVCVCMCAYMHMMYMIMYVSIAAETVRYVYIYMHVCSWVWWYVCVYICIWCIW